MAFINKLSLEKSKIYSAHVKENKLVTIENFLNQEFAETLYDFYLNEMPKDWWTLSARYGKEQTYFYDNDENRDFINHEHTWATSSFVEGDFSYYFYRTFDNHFKTCNCIDCLMRIVLNSEEFVTFFNDLGFSASSTGEVFASLYTKGCFLSPHDDRDKGAMAFTLNLSKNWKPQFGGNLHFLRYDYTDIFKVVVPQFNTITIFDIPTYNKIPHFVSHVQTGDRLAITGWYDK